MTDLAVADPAAGKRSRLSLPLRIVLLVAASIALLFTVGVVIGIGVSAFEHGSLKPRGMLLLGAAALAAGLFGWACWSLSAHWRGPGRSAYEKRYNKMMLVLFASGLPIGLLIGVAGQGRPGDTLFSNGPLDPTLAGVAAAALVVILSGTLIAYHQTIDDHEQQAYLWANSFAFYFLALTFPAAWLLGRGGLIAPLGFGGAMLIMLAAFVVNFAVWAWLKFR